MNCNRSYLFAVTTAVSAIAVCPPVYADQQSEEVLEEIIVTARQRSEKLSEAPVVVSAFSERSIDRSQIREVSDFLAMSANVNFARTTNAGDSAVNIRGVIQPRDTEPPYALVVDGMLSANPQGLNHALFDIQQIEVLKGPQGADYGRNAVGGAIIVTTKKPTNDFTGSFKVGYGSGEEMIASAAVGGPIIEDKLLFRVSVNTIDRGGYYDNLFLNEKIDPYKENSARLRLVWNATDALSFDARVEYGDILGGALAYTPQANLFLPWLISTKATATAIQKFGGGVNTNDASLPFDSNVHNFNNQNRFEVALKANYEMEYGTITVATGYSKINEDLGGEATLDVTIFDPTINPAGANFVTTAVPNYIGFSSAALAQGVQYQERNQEDKSVELRFTSPSDQRVRYIFGGYFADIKRETLTQISDDNGLGNVTPQPVVFDVTRNPTATLLWGMNKNKAYAAFANVAYDLLEDLEVSVSLRWDLERRKNINLTPDILAPAPSVAGSYLAVDGQGNRILADDPGRTRKAEFSRLQPKFTLRYMLDDNTMIFGSYGTGFRSGGFNPPGTRAATLPFVPNTTVQDEFGKETLGTGEIGFKASWLDNNFTLNGAAFFTKIKNAHNFEFNPFASARTVTTIERLDVKGFELEALVRPIPSLQVAAAFGYTDTEVKEDKDNPAAVGNKEPFTPEYTLNLTVQHTYQISESMNLFSRVEFQRLGKTWFNVSNTPGTGRDPINTVNASISVEGDSFTVALWGKNIFDKRYNVDAVVIPLSFGDFSFPYRAPPATYGVTVKYDF